MGTIDISQDFDGDLLVLMDECYNATAIYNADRKPIIAALKSPGSKSRNERGALGINKFKAIGRQVWPTAKSQEPFQFHSRQPQRNHPGA